MKDSFRDILDYYFDVKIEAKDRKEAREEVIRKLLQDHMGCCFLLFCVNELDINDKGFFSRMNSIMKGLSQNSGDYMNDLQTIVDNFGSLNKFIKGFTGKSRKMAASLVAEGLYSRNFTADIDPAFNYEKFNGSAEEMIHKLHLFFDKVNAVQKSTRACRPKKK